MPTETIEFQVTGLSQAVSGMNTMAGAVSGVGTSGEAAVSGLVGIAGALARVSPEAGVAVTAIALFVAAVVAVGKVTTSLAHQLQGLSVEGAKLGSSTETTAFLGAAGRLGGFDPAALAHQIRSEAFSPAGAMALHGLGIGTPPPIDTNRAFDEGQMLVRIIEALQQLNPQEQVLRLRQLHAEGLMPLVQGGKAATDALRAQAQAQAALASPEHIAAAIRFNAEMEILKIQLTDLGLRFVNWLIPILDRFGLGAETGVSRTLDRHTAAMEAHSAALSYSTRDLPFGQFGGGSRFRTAIPGAYQNSFAAGRVLQTNAAMWGSFSFAQ